MADNDEFGALFRAAVEQHVAGMSPEDFAAMTARVCPPTDPASVRRSIAAKAQQMAETPRSVNGGVAPQSTEPPQPSSIQ